MIRFAVFCTFLTIVGYSFLPKWRAEFTRPFFETCLRNTPISHHKSEIQSLVCGSTLHKSRLESRDQTSEVIAAWRSLGLIHILVVSGGHLSILAALLTLAVNLFTRNRLNTAVARRASFVVIGCMLALFCLANRLQPPVLRALIEWYARRPLERRGWRPPETALMSTWLSLPFSSSIYDLLSLALAFFASVTVEQTARSLHRHRWLAAIALQTAVWWVLLPLLFTMGVPHPLSTMVNVVLAPLMGVSLIPLAMVTWFSGFLPPLVAAKDPVGLGYIFDFVWEKISIAISFLADVLPTASPRIGGQKPLLFGFETTMALLVGIAAATAALLIRSRRERRRESVTSSQLWPLLVVAFGFLLAIAVHRNLM